MTLQEYNKKPARYPLSAWLVTGLILFFGNNVQAGVNGQLPEFNTTQPYLIYYGNWTAGQVDYARNNQTGIPDENANFENYYVRAGAPGKHPPQLAADIAVIAAAQKAFH